MRSSGDSLWRTLGQLQGNPRACVWTEPLWGLSMALVLPYLSVFMLAVGLGDEQIGLLASIGMVSQVFFGLAGGIITDRLGRRATTAWFDVVAWVIPCILWAFAQNFWVFLAASLVNGAWQVTQNSWDALMVEDAERGKITRIYSLVKVAADCSALFAPIAALLVSQLGLDTAVRILFVNAAVVMTAKIIWLYRWSSETRQGKVRMAQTRDVSVWKLLAGYRSVAGLLLRSKGSVLSLGIMALVAAVTLVNGTFWQVLVSQHLHVPDAVLPFFPMVRSLLSMLLFFTLIPRLTTAVDLKKPTLWGFGVYLAGQLLLVTIPAANGSATLATYVFLGVCLLLDAFGGGMMFMLSESLVALHVDEAERSRVMALQRTVVMLAAAPFGWISGLLSGMNRTYPFLLTAALLVVGLAVTWAKWVPTQTDVDAALAGDAEQAPR
ncbi:major facilitator superfamily MFS_1 [Xylanimonas cellulosilytica DSM 15894]|uniref:Major facilitator superfamily MFS_1 n=1 Tax=Xylanimonas cellulosilytica (strain DSM 15894 / JCM 12276 / CECT 5975 / KCTC 9989 / LMG 20990 / NBRC 107835 / XIL07) TaxID=446471 RepID=D1C064_XYLCX|nr:MFS transporter [Xylanimonas cellulosilytica]ACZ30253.1 major facilitator superfamily MFS_1 [Xylanimonas cellulosilytica DSM 15894]